MGHLPYFWYRATLIWWPRLIKNLAVFLDNRLAVKLNWFMLFTPMFHDTSFLGRLLSFIVRGIKIIFGSTVIFIAAVTGIFWWLVWTAISPILFLLWPLDIARQLLQGDQSLSLEVKKILRLNHDQPKLFAHHLLSNPEIINFVTRLEISPITITGLNLPFSISQWQQLAKQESHVTIKPIDFILALLKQNHWRYQIGITTARWLRSMKYWARIPFIWNSDYATRPIGGVDRAQTGIPTPNLDKVSDDLTKMAQKKQLPEMIGKAEAVTKMVKILSRQGKNHVLIVGEPGSGKTTLVKALAQEIVRGINVASLRFKRLVSLSPSRLAAGADSGSLAERIETIIKEIANTNNIILFVDEVHHLALVNRDQPENSSIFRALEPALNDGTIQFIGATSTENYRKYIEPNEAFTRLFEIVELPEATPAASESLLEYLAWERENKQDIIITRLAISRMVELAQKFFHDRVLPDKAVNLLDEAVAQIDVSGNKIINTLTIDRLVAEKTKVPMASFNQDEAKILLNLEAKLHQKIIGQEAAIKAIAQALRRARTQIKSLNKPIASFLFAGPTGVGKTETAKALTSEFFGNAKSMIRLDMSEYQTEDSADRLLDNLSLAIRQQPYALLLLDEIEKANRRILNLFLQVIDDARLTDTAGKTADFSNAFIIATTNVPPKKIKTDFAPEWLNRFTGIIVFKALNRIETEAVIKLKLAELTKNLQSQEIKINFEPNTAKKLALEAFSEEWGGREADRVIQNKVSNLIAEKILSGAIKKNLPYSFKL